MRFLFTAPFRTTLNLRTDVALANEVITTEILSSTVKKLSRKINISSDWSLGNETSLRYASLQDDWVPVSARPLFKVRLDSEEDIDLIKGKIEQTLDRENGRGIVINSAKICLYDNTIALLILDVTFSSCANATDRGRLLARIDESSTDFCKMITDYFQITVVSLVAENLFEKANRRKKQTRGLPEFMRTPAEFVVYFDISKIAEGFSIVVNTTLWVNRVLFVDNIEADDGPHLQKWTQTDLEIDVDQANRLGLRAFNVGNSVFVCDLPIFEKQSFQTALNTAQYYYSLYDVIDGNLRCMFPKLSMKMGRRRLDKLEQRIHQSLTAIEFIGVEMGDVLRGMQGYTRQWIDRIFNTWNFQAVRDSVARKCEMTNNRLEKLVSERNLGYRRWVEGFLALIGAITLIDSAINLLTFSKSEDISKDDITGLVDFFRSLPPDGLFYAVALMGVMMAVIYGRKAK